MVEGGCSSGFRVAVVIPCYRVRAQVLDVIASLPDWLEKIYVVDDACPENSGAHVGNSCADIRVEVLTHERNSGVGGAVITGYMKAYADGMDVIVKMDGDGQMDPLMLEALIAPILRGEADYAKGNRFYDLSGISAMPVTRIVGNAVLSFMTKVSSGYWGIFDPTNGFTAIHAGMLSIIPVDKISRRYFFETDTLFRLNIARAVVVDVPMHARYGEEISNLNIKKVLLDFLVKHSRNAIKRVFYSYFLRDLSLASIELLFGLSLMTTGTVTGVCYWLNSSAAGVFTSAGPVMLAAIQILVGLQLILGFLAYDIGSAPKTPMHRLLPPRGRGLLG